MRRVKTNVRVLYWDHCCGQWDVVPQGFLSNCGMPQTIVHPSKWNLETLSICDHFYWLTITPEVSIFPTPLGCICIWTKQSPPAWEESPEVERKPVQVWSGMLSPWPQASLELSTITVSEISYSGYVPGNVLRGTKNVRYKFSDVLLKGNSPSTGILRSEVSIIFMGPITHCF